jgi:Fe2+ or Zn2+ uptake regulation protein
MTAGACALTEQAMAAPTKTNVDEMCKQADPASEVEHFVICPECGQIFDCREEAEVRHHARANHEPIL